MAWKNQQYDRLMTFKTRDILGLRKHVEDPVVIPEEDTINGGSTKRMKSWDGICKGLSQWRFSLTHLEVCDNFMTIA